MTNTPKRTAASSRLRNIRRIHDPADLGAPSACSGSTNVGIIIPNDGCFRFADDGTLIGEFDTYFAALSAIDGQPKPQKLRPAPRERKGVWS